LISDLPYSDSIKSGSRKYPIDLSFPQSKSNSTPLLLVITPGIYVTLFGVTSTLHPN